jgi:electron transfer flavoprotein alpha/beta subunit
MKLHNIKIIEDKSAGTEIPITDTTLFAGPIDIQTAEMYEACLDREGTPYILAQFETTDYTNEIIGMATANHVNGPMVEPLYAPKFARGYGIFLAQQVGHEEAVNE